jgi:hypothetical protein
VFEDRIISRGLWPPKSQNLIFCDFYLWGNLQGKVYKNNPHSIEALQNEITCVIGSIAVDELQNVARHFCKQKGGSISASVINHGKFVLSFYSIFINVCM